jgi:hypothetical protein
VDALIIAGDLQPPAGRANGARLLANGARLLANAEADRW